MLELEITPATIGILVVIAVLVVLAVRRLFKKGTCDHKEGLSGAGCAGCSSCGSVDKMLADMEKAAKNS